MSKFMEHAEKELRLFGCDMDDFATKDVLKLIKVFSDSGHSGTSAEWALDIFNKLVRWENLAPLTRNKEEWELAWTTDEGEPFYQNRRNSSILTSDPEFKTGYHVDTGEKIIIEKEK